MNVIWVEKVVFVVFDNINRLADIARYNGVFTQHSLNIPFISLLKQIKQRIMKNITPFLWFDNNAEEAMNFYTSVFPNSKVTSVSRYTEAGPGPAGQLMVAAIQINGQRFNLLNGGPGFQFSWAVSFVVECENQQEVDHYWKELTADGGEESQCGWVKDKFGLSWQITPTIMEKFTSDPDPKKVSRVMQTMMKMKKLDIQTLQDAYDDKL